MPVLLGTIRPAGALGDQSDTTYVSGSAFDGTLFVPSSPVALGTIVAAPDGIAHVDLYARVAWWPTGFGPVDPSINIRWRVGATGELFSDIYIVVSGVELFSEIPPVQVPPSPLRLATQPNGQPWTLAAVNDVRVRCSFYCDSQFSGEESNCAVSELRAEVWGNDPPPPSSPQLVDRVTLGCPGTDVATLGCGRVDRVTLECRRKEEV